MVCRTETKTINDHEYSVTQWSAEKSILMKFKLIKAFGSSLAKLASISSDSSDQEEVKSFSEGLASLFDSNSPEELVALMKSCVIGVALDGKRITESSFNEVFSADDILEIYKVFIFVIQVNYQNFMKGQFVENLLVKMKENQ